MARRTYFKFFKFCFRKVENNSEGLLYVASIVIITFVTSNLDCSASLVSRKEIRVSATSLNFIRGDRGIKFKQSQQLFILLYPRSQITLLRVLLNPPSRLLQTQRHLYSCHIVASQQVDFETKRDYCSLNKVNRYEESGLQISSKEQIRRDI